MLRQYLENIGGNRTVMALSFARLGDGVGNSILFIVIPIYAAQLPSPIFDLPETVRVGILISIFGLVTAVFQPFMGAWSDRAGKRKLFIQGGLLLMFASSLGFVLANQFSYLFILRSLQGIGVALTVPAAVALIATSSHQQTRGGSMGIYTTFRMVGLAIGPLLGGFIYVQYGFDAAFFAGGAFILLGIVMVQLWVRDLKPTPEEKAYARKSKVFDRDLITAGILGAAFATFVMASAFSMMAPLERQFNARLDQTAFGFGIAFSALTISRLIFQVPLGHLSDKYGRKPFIIGGLLLMAPATALLGYTATTFQLTLARLFQGFASAGIAAPAFAVAADIATRGGEGRQMSIITMGFGLGVAVGPLIAGMLALYSFQMPFIVGGVLTIAGAWIVYRFVPETVGHHKQVQPESAAQEEEEREKVREP